MTNEELYASALTLSSEAFAKYSQFHVGAIVIFENGSLYQGVNIENISYGLTSCAERNAIFSAYRILGREGISKVIVANSESKDCSPCGACRQVIAEFATSATTIVYRHCGHLVETKLSDLLPDTFLSI
jgi:cytidine deaminase